MSRATLFGVTTSVLRMAFGGHFFTDVAAAGLVTFLVIWLAYRYIYRWPSTRLTDESIDAALTRCLARFPATQRWRGLGVRPQPTVAFVLERQDRKRTGRGTVASHSPSRLHHAIRH